MVPGLRPVAIRRTLFGVRVYVVGELTGGAWLTKR